MIEKGDSFANERMRGMPRVKLNFLWLYRLIVCRGLVVVNVSKDIRNQKINPRTLL